MALKQKISLLLVVSLGVLVIVAAVVRLETIVKVDESADKPCKQHSKYRGLP